MTAGSGDRRPRGGGGTRGLAVRDAGALVFAADMYGIQVDQLARLTGGERSARAAAARWRELGYAETARLSRGAAWLWVTRAGLAACGLGYSPARPRSPGWRTSGRSPPLASRSRQPAATAGRALSGAASGGSGPGTGRRAPAPAGCGGALAGRGVRPGRCADWLGWRVLGGRGRAHAEDGRPHHVDHARDPAPHRGLRLPCRRGRRPGPSAPARAALYLCSPAALPTVLRARAELGPWSARIEVRDLPPDAPL